MKFRVEADRHVIVVGLGTFAPDETREFTEYDADQFFFMRGVKLSQDNVPDGVTVTVVIEPSDNTEEE